ncbi:outer membrane biogenesis protein BamB [Thalassoglobus neptunius]|uniref:Outer membrane biogenesis protein BamB n=1 Tax=Thalassoglobus neptunius TaxID=1938619 RepID=A0A5C5X6Q3_9PLAN|nr:PQQ-binding-like beta-propeller repeat protein [Thalassoglobus neptunius]TWT58716.1 outer membrane biogenesis protein BamB [Thalassoglobus neptunius]
MPIRFLAPAVLILALSSFSQTFAEFPTAEDWPNWRGPLHTGEANPEQNPPVNWSNSENIAWTSRVLGKGHGSPIIVGDQIVLATSDDEAEIRFLVSYDRSTGEQSWITPIHSGNATPPRNEKGTQASATPACDGERIYINFLHDGAAWTSAVSLDGEILWQTRITPYTVHQGYGSSPFLFGDLVIVSADNKSGGAIAGLNRSNGEIVWKHQRPKKPNYSSPVVYQTSGSDQLLMTGCDLVTSLNPQTGEVNWEIEGATTECVTTTVATNGLIYASGGYPKNHLSAVRTDGSGEVVWENGTRVYVPSMLIKDDRLYAVTDAGVAMCWDALTGDEIWKGRLGGTFSSSPILIDDKIYATNEEGLTYVFLASPDELQLLAKNQLGEICFASPAVSHDQLFIRYGEMVDGKRQEFLACISTSEN